MSINLSDNYMKSLFLILFLLSFGEVFSQSTYDGQPIIYDEVVTIENMDAETLFLRAQSAITNIYENPKEVTVISDINNHTLTINAAYYDETYNSFNASKQKYTVNYTINLAFKDGRYRYIVNNIRLSGYQISKGTYSRDKELYDNDLITSADMSEREFNLRPENKRQTPDKVYTKYREVIKKYMNNLTTEIKQQMQQTSISEDTW